MSPNVQPTFSASSSDEADRITKIGSGSFATIYALPTIPFACKVVHSPDGVEELRKEYDSHHSLYMKCNSDSFFAIPRPIAFYDPALDHVDQFPPSPATGGARRRASRTFLDTNFFATHEIPRPGYVMDRLHGLPMQISTKIRELYYPPRAKQVQRPRLCRLYFGKEVQMPRIGLVNSANFPIDLARYETLLEVFPFAELPPSKAVAAGMGQMLSRIHWIAGYDARDIEFVFAGSAFEAGFHLIDFNQMRKFDRDEPQFDLLADAFTSNDPYYPKPDPTNSLYQAFSAAYVQEAGEYADAARTFLQVIEDRYARRASDHGDTAA